VNDELLQLVRNHLDRESEAVDPRPVFDRLHFVPPNAKQSRRVWRLGSLFALAASLMIAVFFWPAPSVRADAAAIVADAVTTHHQSLDRVYVVETLREPMEDGAPPPRIGRLFTRGDRFWMEGAMPGPPGWSFGQDESGAVWATAGPRRGVKLEANEVPWGLQYWCEMHALRPERFLNDVLRDFDLRREPGKPGTTIDTITATRKTSRPAAPLKRVKLEIDRESKVMRKVVLEREFPEGNAVTTIYTLIDTRDEDDKRYSIEGHLTAPYEIFTRDKDPGKRREILERLFGPRMRMGQKG